MIHSEADIIRYVLVTLGLGNLPSNPNAHTWPISVDQEPDQPDNAITVYNTSPQPQGRLQVSGLAVEHAGFMVQVRCTDSQAGKTKIREILAALTQDINRTTVTISNSRGTASYMIQAVTRRSGPNTLGRDHDNENRFLFTLNCTASIS